MQSGLFTTLQSQFRCVIFVTLCAVLILIYVGDLNVTSSVMRVRDNLTPADARNIVNYSAILDNMRKSYDHILPCKPWHNGKTIKVIETPTNGGTALTENSIVIFTTFKNVEHRLKIHNNTIKNWATLRPFVQPVLFDDSTHPLLMEAAKEHGWKVLQLYPKPPSEPPKVRYMFTEAHRHFPRADYIGLANADILFDAGLLLTLGGLLTHAQRWAELVVLGTRYNMYNKQGAEIYKPAHVHTLIQNNITDQISPWYEDLFFIYKNRYPWEKYHRDIVIGRLGYDNYLSGLAVRDNLPVVDGSCTIGALHQMGYEGISAGFMNKDSRVNLKLIKDFPTHKGILSNLPYYTKFDKHGELVVNKKS